MVDEHWNVAIAFHGSSQLSREAVVALYGFVPLSHTDEMVRAVWPVMLTLICACGEGVHVFL